MSHRLEVSTERPAQSVCKRQKAKAPVSDLEAVLIQKKSHNTKVAFSRNIYVTDHELLVFGFPEHLLSIICC